MRKYLLLMLVIIVPVLCMAQGVEPEGKYEVDLGTFAGIVAFVSTIATQITKLFKGVEQNDFAKIGISSAVGIVVCMVAWLLKLSPLLADIVWWEALIYGLVAGLAGCGFYDAVIAFGNFIKKIHIIKRG